MPHGCKPGLPHPFPTVTVKTGKQVRHFVAAPDQIRSPDKCCGQKFLCISTPEIPHQCTQMMQGFDLHGIVVHFGKMEPANSRVFIPLPNRKRCQAFANRKHHFLNDSSFTSFFHTAAQCARRFDQRVKTAQDRSAHQLDAGPACRANNDIVDCSGIRAPHSGIGRKQFLRYKLPCGIPGIDLEENIQQAFRVLFPGSRRSHNRTARGFPRAESRWS